MEYLYMSDALYGWIVVGISTFCFGLISASVSKWATPGPKTLPRENNREWRWKNILVSLVHSILCGVWTLLSFYDCPKLASDMINTYTPMSQTLISMTVGYFIYDIFDMLVSCRERSSYEFILHHCTVIFTFSIAITMQLYIGYATVALTIEINSIFLHTRQLMQLVKVPRTYTSFRLITLLNLGTYIVFRIGVLAWMTRWLFLNHALVPLPLYAVGSLGLATMTVMNIILFYRLIVSDFGARDREKLSKQD